MSKDNSSSHHHRKLRWPRQISFILFTLVMTALLVKLGFWQLSRADEKKALLTQMSAYKTIETDDIATLSEMPKGSHIALKGYFLPEKSVLLDNQVYRSHVGYRWFVPFYISSHHSMVLADLGWLPAGEQRAKDITTPTLEGEFSLSGTLDLPSSRFVLKPSTPELPWPLRVQSVDLSELSSFYEGELVPWILRVDEMTPENTASLSWSFHPQWTPVVMKPEKHIGYAVQWFGLAIATVVGLGIWCKKEML